MIQTITVKTRGREAFYDITSRVQEAVAQSGVEEGICLVFCPHTTAAVTLNENWDRTVQDDLCLGLGSLAPERRDYQHLEGNSPAHLKSSLLGASQVVPVSEGRVVLGKWQGLYLVEFDGPRERRVVVKVVEG
ncbi:MAG: YjbQ family protein [Chloroflexi bacterium]|nr:YjbQ family protein [Chloroflexota bacterium]